MSSGDLPHRCVRDCGGRTIVFDPFGTAFLSFDIDRVARVDVCCILKRQHYGHFHAKYALCVPLPVPNSTKRGPIIVGLYT